MFKSEIRESTINDLLEKAAKLSYQRYLPKIILKRMRGFSEEPVSFDFPVTALIGPNGGGKTTILGSAAIAYKAISPKRFFAKSGKYDESMQDWVVEYEIVDRILNAKDIVRRTASFRNLRWNREAPERNVLLFGVARTVPANERSEMLRCMSGTFEVPEDRIQAIAGDVCHAVSRILGKDISEFKRMLVDAEGRTVLLTGRTKDGKKYSEFHFGAGESSIIRMVAEIELAEEQTLVLIEEIENGLHPVATIRMVEYLIDAAKRKKIQAIFTTHSNDALAPLPSKAIWVATQNRIFQGKLDVQSLRAITGQIEAQLVVFVEDKFAKIWFEAILRQKGGISLDHVEIHAMQGDGMATAINRYHNSDPSTHLPSVCFVDGDSRQEVAPAENSYRLPGEAPESHVFDAVLERWSEFGGRLSVALLQKFEHEQKILDICREVRTTNRDTHLLFAQVGDRIGLIPESTVAAAFANIWAQAFPEEVDRLLAPIVGQLPLDGNTT